ncbi:MAG TPA: carboxymuconolactone decarboxylase family protein [Gemmatimonadaceae bacterium]
MASDQAPAGGPFADVAPALDEITQKVLFGEVLERPGLSKRDGSLIAVATLIAGYRTNELPFHLKRALENGVATGELVEPITHLAFYAGWPPASTAVAICGKSSRTRDSERQHAGCYEFSNMDEKVIAGARREPYHTAPYN